MPYFLSVKSKDPQRAIRNTKQVNGTHPSMHVHIVLPGLLDSGADLFVLRPLGDDYGCPSSAGATGATAITSAVVGHCGRRCELERNLGAD